MNKLMRIGAIIIIGMALTPSTLVNAEPVNNLDELYRRVVAGINADSKRNAQLIADFEKRRNEQRGLLGDAKQDVDNAKQLSEQLRGKINNNELDLDALNKQLKDRLGNFGELFGVTRQVAADTRAQVVNSLISAQFPNRDKILDEIATSKSLPTIEQLRALWAILLQEQMEQGKVTRFNALVEINGQDPIQQEVLRLGPFNALMGNQFVNYQPSSQQLATLGRQPPSIYKHSANALLNAQPGDLVKATIDPSSGAILDLLIDMPSTWDRFQYGGLPGYIVTFLAVIGLTMGLQRLFRLTYIARKVNWQTRNDSPNSNNPLGRVLQVYADNPSVDVETLELKLNDAILKETPKLERGLNTLKVLAAVAPLLGLLGTVVGMINTFQVITLWGAGDPKLMADGISQALVTTVQGLIAAIPLLLLHSVTSGRAKLVQQILEEQSAGLIARRAEQQGVAR